MKQPFKRTLISSAVLSASLGGVSTASYGQNTALEEVVVTATRRDQSIQEVPYNISAITGSDMAEQGISDQADLFRLATGVNYIEQGARSGVNNSNLIIRGINAEVLSRNSGPLQTAPVVSTYINETPVFVNLRMRDLDRVEILRGPQGTLYGSGSLGGSVRYLYNKPDFTEFGGEVSGGLSQTKNADDLNYEVDLMLNIPLGDTFGMRINAGYEDQAGFVDQPARYVRRADGSPELDNGSTDPIEDSANFFAGQPVFESADGVNEADSTSARLALSWVPSDAFEANLNYIYQTDDASGNQMNSWDFYGEDSLKNAALIEEPFERDVDILALDVNYDMGFASFTATASTYQSEGGGSRDLTGFYEQFSFYTDYYGSSPRPLIEDISKFDDQGDVFEARLVSQGDNTLDWVVGLYYMEQDTDSEARQFYYGYDDYSTSCFIETDTFGGDPCGFGTLFGFEETNGPVPIVKDEAYLTLQTNEFKDRAVFGELTWNITDRWQITGGARYYDQDFETSQTGGLEFVPDGVEQRSLKTDDSDTLFKFNTSYLLGDNHNVYAVWSEGFRRGGANGLPNTAFGFPVNSKAFLYEPDTTENIELGIKGSFGAYQYTVALYDVEWDNLQSNLSCTGLGLLCVVNVGEASSRGLEAEFSGQLIDNLDFNIAYTYNDSELESLNDTTQEFIDDGTLFTPVPTGVPLPGASEHSFYLNAMYHQQLSNGMEINYGLNGSYRSETESSLEETSIEVDEYWLWNAGVGLVAQSWSARLFVNNIGDERGLMGADSVALWGPRANAIISTPRTFGISARYTF